MGWLVRVKDVLEALSYLTILVGFPLAIYQFWRAARKEALDREYGTYNALDEKYLEFQRLCLENPRLDIFDISDPKPNGLTPEEEKKELIAFTMLFSIFERSYLMYSAEDSNLKARQWTGWNEYISAYCKRDNFRRAWQVSGNTFDTDYQNYMAKMILPSGRKEQEN
jgi:hypothetical protein